MTHLCAQLYLHRSSFRMKAVDAASGEGELSDKACETVGAPVRFKSDAWKHFGFLVSGNEKGK